MNDSTITRRSALTILGGTIMAVAALPAVPLTAAQRKRVAPVALEMHRAIMDSMEGGPTGRDLSRVVALADRLVSEDRDVAHAAFTLVQGIYEYAVAVDDAAA